MIRIIAATRTAMIVLGIMIGGPVMLAAVAGSPIPRQRPSADQVQTWLQDPLNPAYATATARTLAWTIWAIITTAICALLGTHLRKIRWSKLAGYLPPPTQSLTAALLGTAAVTTALPSAALAHSVSTTSSTDPHHLEVRHTATDIVLMPATMTAPPASAPRPQADTLPANPASPRARGTVAHHVSAHHALPQPEPRTAITATPTGHHHGHAVPARAAHAPGGVHHVVRGDNLWDIAAHQLGDPHRWREIYVLNRGHQQANGYALTDPDEIHIGWVLAMPAHDRGPAAAQPSAPTQPHPAAPTTEATPTSPVPDGAATANPSTPQSPAPSTAAPSTAAPSTAVPGRATPSAEPATGNTAASAAPTGTAPTTGEHPSRDDRHAGVTLPSQGWISLGLAASIAAVAALLRLRRRRFTRLVTPIPVRTGRTRAPVPPEFTVADAAGRRDLDPDIDPESTAELARPGARPVPPRVPAPIGVDAAGVEVSLFELPGPGLALLGDGAEPVARAILASALATGVLDNPATRPVVVTSIGLLARLLPVGAEVTGLDPHAVTFDGERLLVLADVADVVTHAEEEMIGRRRQLDQFGVDTITDLNARPDHAEAQPPYVLLLDAADRYTARLAAVAAHRAALQLHLVALGRIDGLPAMTVAADGTLSTAEAALLGGGRLATLTAPDLAQVLAMIADAAARPEAGTDLDTPAEPAETGKDDDQTPAVALDPIPDLPTSSTGTPPLVRLCVLGPVTVTAETGPVTTGMRSGSYAVLAVLAAHPRGRTLEQIAADVHPDTDPVAAVKRLRTDITTARRVLRAATGTAEAMFIVHDPATGRYRLDPDTIEVDLWRMLTAIGRANTATEDAETLAALREAADLYGGDFADSQDRAWVTDYATTHRAQILGVYARIAELLEADQPDAAVAALDHALRYDPVNEELYQRIMRIHGRQHRPDAVRRTLRRLEDQLAELGGAEPSEATRRVAARQLRPAVSGVGA